MCTKLTNTPLQPMVDSRCEGPTMIPMFAGRKCRANEDTFAVVYCQHLDGRMAVHFLQPREAITDNEDVYIKILKTWLSPQFLLTDKTR